VICDSNVCTLSLVIDSSHLTFVLCFSIDLVYMLFGNVCEFKITYAEIYVHVKQTTHLLLLYCSVNPSIAIYTVSQKNDTDVAYYNYDIHQGILIIFDTYVAKKISN